MDEYSPEVRSWSAWDVGYWSNIPIIPKGRAAWYPLEATRKAQMSKHSGIKQPLHRTCLCWRRVEHVTDVPMWVVVWFLMGAVLLSGTHPLYHQGSKEHSLILTWYLSQLMLKSPCTVLRKSPLVQFVGKLLRIPSKLPFFPCSEPSVFTDDPFGGILISQWIKLTYWQFCSPDHLLSCSKGVFWLNRQRLISIPPLSQDSLDWFSLASVTDFKPENVCIRLCWGEALW